LTTWTLRGRARSLRQILLNKFIQQPFLSPS